MMVASIYYKIQVLLFSRTPVPSHAYNRNHYNHLLTNSLKAEHYLTSGLNRIPTSARAIQDCVAHAFDPSLSSGKRPTISAKAQPQHASSKSHKDGEYLSHGNGLSSQGDFTIIGRALATDVAITYLGYVNRDTGIEEAGHPLDGGNRRYHSSVSKRFRLM